MGPRTELVAPIVEVKAVVALPAMPRRTHHTLPNLLLLACAEEAAAPVVEAVAAAAVVAVEKVVEDVAAAVAAEPKRAQQPIPKAWPM
jgi:acetaldehyde dehydrogenase (acetylating)